VLLVRRRKDVGEKEREEIEVVSLHETMGGEKEEEEVPLRGIYHMRWWDVRVENKKIRKSLGEMVGGKGGKQED